ncbi:MAG: hypothetical protein ACFFDY_00540 [Candidatus Thorarchaeota archaeon]
MFKAKNTIYSMNTIESLNKITSSTKFKSMQLSFSLTKLKVEYEKGKEVVEEERKKIIERLCEKGEDGNPKMTLQGQYNFNSKNGLKVQEEIRKLYETTVTDIHMDKITLLLDEIPEGLLSPDDMYNLMELIDFKEPKSLPKNEKSKNIGSKK